MYHLIETNKIGLDKGLIEQVHSLNPDEKHADASITDIREAYQYGVPTSLESKTLEKLLRTAKTLMDQAKEEIEK